MKAVIFDFDGTIADTLGIVMEEAEKIAEEEGYDWPEHPMELRDKKVTELIDMFSVPKIKIPFYVKKLRDKVGDRLHEVPVFDGMKEVVEELSEDYKLGVLSSNNEENILRFLENHSMLEHFDEIVTGLSIFGKSGKIKKLVKKLGVKKSEAIYVADGERDIEACKDDNVPIISVSWGYNSKELLQENNPDFLVNEAEEILKIIDSA